MSAQAAYDAGYASGIKGILQNTNYSATSSIQTSYNSGYNAGRTIYQPAFAAGYKDAALSFSRNTLYSGTKAVQSAYNAGYYSLTQTNKIGVAASYDWFLRASISSTPITSIDFDSNDNIIFCGMYSTGTQVLYNKDGSVFKTLTATTSYAIFIAKYTYDGIGIWAISLDGTGSWDVALRTKVDTSDNILVSCFFTGNITIKNADESNFQTLTNLGGYDSFIIKYNSSGIGQWIIKTSSGSDSDGLTWCDTDQLGNIYISFFYTSPITFVNADGTTAVTLTNSGIDTAIIKFNSSGIYQWNSRISSTGTDAITSLVVDNKNNIYLGGYYPTTATIYNTDATTYGTLANSGSNDCFIIKYNSNGQIQWTTRIGSTGSDIPFNLLVDSFNNLYVAGYYDATLTFYNSSGSAYSTTLAVVGATDNFIAKYNENGSVQWITRIGGIGTESNEAGSWAIHNKFAIDKFNNIYLANSFTSTTLNFYSASNLNTVVGTLTNTATRNGFMAKYDSSGNYIYSLKTGNSSTNSTYGDTLILDNYNYLYLAISNVGGTATLFDSSQVQIASLTASNNIYLVKYNQRDTTLLTAYSAGYSAGYNSYQTGPAQNTSYSIHPSIQGAYDAGYLVGSTYYYNMGYAAGINGIVRNNTFSTITAFQTEYNSGYNTGNQLYIQAFADGYKDSSLSKARVIDLYPTYAANEYLLAAYYQGYDHYKDAVQTTTLKSEWYARTASTGADRSEAVAKDSQNNIYYGGYTAVATTVYNKNNVNASMGWSATTQTGFIVKQTREGTSQWASRFTSSSTVGRVYSIICDSNNNVYTYGIFNGTLTLYDSNGVAYGTTLAATSTTNAAFLVKHNSAGKIQWVTRIVPSASTGVVTAATIAYDATTDTICVNGSYSDTSTTPSRIFVYNSSGTIQDTLPYSSTSSPFLIKYSTSGVCQWAAAVKQQLHNMIPTTDGLVAYLDPANPSSYSGVGATMTSLVGSVTGTLGGSYSYANGIIRLNNTSATGTSNVSYLQLPSITFRTISMWVYMYSASTDIYLLDGRTGNGTAYIYKNPTTPDGNNLGAFWLSGTLYVNGGNAITTTQSGFWSNISSGSWQHITIVATSSGIDDLTLFGRYTLNAGANISFGPIQIYDRVITQAENLANYNATKSRFITDPVNLPIPTTSGLVAYFDPANPSSYPGSGATITSLVGSVSASIVGSYSYSGNVIRLNNTTTSYASNNNAFRLNSNINFRTVSMWVYIHSTSADYSSIIDARSGVPNGYIDSGGVGSFWTSGTLYKNGGSTLSITSANIFGTVGSWQHITLVAPSSGTDTIMFFGLDGGVRTDAITGLNCSFGSIQIYDRVLTQEENLANYNATKDRFNVLLQHNVVPRALSIDSTGDIYQIGDVTGTTIVYDASGTNTGTVTSAGLTDIIIAKYSATGAYKWHTRISSTGADIAYSSAVDASNNLCIVGQYGSLLTFYDASGVAYGSQLTTIGGIDGFVTKYNSTGAIEFISKLGGAGTDYGVSVATDRDNNIYLLANAGTNVNFYNSSNTIERTVANASSYPIIAKYNSTGSLIWNNIVAADFSTLRSKFMLVDDTYNVYIAGGATATAITDTSGVTTYTLPNAGSTDAVLLKYRQTNSSATDYQQGYTYQNSIVDASAQYNTSITFTNTYNTSQPLKQLSYNAGRLALYETLQTPYYVGYNDAMKNKASNVSSYYTTSQTQLRVAYLSGYSKGVTDYKTAFAAGYKDAQQNNARNSSYSSSAYSLDIIPKQEAYDEGYYSKPSSDLSANLMFNWHTRIGNTTISEYGRYTAVDKNNDVYHCGYYQSAASLYDTSGSVILNLSQNTVASSFLIKQNQAGQILKAYRITSLHGIYLERVTVDSKNNVYCACNFYKSAANPGSTTIYLYDANTNALINSYNYSGGGELSPARPDCFILKLTPDGVPIWNTFIGGVYQQYARELLVDKEDNVWFIGQKGLYDVNIYDRDGVNRLNIPYGGGFEDNILIKFSSDGYVIFAGQTTLTNNDSVVSAATDNQSNIYMAGYHSGATTFNFYVPSGSSMSTPASFSVSGGSFIIKINKNGVFQWANYSYPWDYVVCDNDNNVLAKASTPRTQKFDPSGNSLWFKTAANDIMYNAIFDSQNNIYARFGTPSRIGKFDPSGNALTDISFVHNLRTVSSITLDNTDSLYIVGDISGTRTGYNSNGTVAYTVSSGNDTTTDSILVKYRQKNTLSQHYTAGYNAYSSSTYNSSYSTNARIQASYDAGFRSRTLTTITSSAPATIVMQSLLTNIASTITTENKEEIKQQIIQNVSKLVSPKQEVSGNLITNFIEQKVSGYDETAKPKILVVPSATPINITEDKQALKQGTKELYLFGSTDNVFNLSLDNVTYSITKKPTGAQYNNTLYTLGESIPLGAYKFIIKFLGSLGGTIEFDASGEGYTRGLTGASNNNPYPIGSYTYTTFNTGYTAGKAVYDYNLTQGQAAYDAGYAVGYAAGKVNGAKNNTYNATTGQYNGYEAGFTQGKADYDTGYDAGYAVGKVNGTKNNTYTSTSGQYNGYEAGFTQGKSGYDTGYSAGYAVGKVNGTKSNTYTAATGQYIGYEAGFTQGKADYTTGYEAGNAVGKVNGTKSNTYTANTPQYNGYEAGYTIGKSGYDAGYNIGYAIGKVNGTKNNTYTAATAQYNGYEAGYTASKALYDTGYTAGYTVGKNNQTKSNTYLTTTAQYNGYEAGFTQGKADYDTGYTAGYAVGKIAGTKSNTYQTTTGQYIGYEAGFIQGKADYDIGYAAGYAIGKVNGTKSNTYQTTTGQYNGYEAGFTQGKADYDTGYAAGYAIGIDNQIKSNTYQTTTGQYNGYEAGYTAGNILYIAAYNAGYAVGKIAGTKSNTHQANSGEYNGYEAGYSAAKALYDTGYTAGYADGKIDGLNANNYTAATAQYNGYEAGFTQGKADYATGYNAGYTAGKTDGSNANNYTAATAQHNGYEAGFTQGKADYATGYTAGYAHGIDNYTKSNTYTTNSGQYIGYEAGYTAGKTIYNAAYNAGYTAGLNGDTKSNNYIVNSSQYNGYEAGYTAGKSLYDTLAQTTSSTIQMQTVLSSITTNLTTENKEQVKQQIIQNVSKLESTKQEVSGNAITNLIEDKVSGYDESAITKIVILPTSEPINITENKTELEQVTKELYLFGTTDNVFNLLLDNVTYTITQKPTGAEYNNVLYTLGQSIPLGTYQFAIKFLGSVGGAIEFDASGEGYARGITGLSNNNPYPVDSYTCTTFNIGYAEGKAVYDAAYDAGYLDGANNESQNTSYNAIESLQTNYNNGYSAGYAERTVAYNTGYAAGIINGTQNTSYYQIQILQTQYNDGYGSGNYLYDTGYAAGYAVGKTGVGKNNTYTSGTGEYNGYEAGYTAGKAEYDTGYAAGYAVGKTGVGKNNTYSAGTGQYNGYEAGYTAGKAEYDTGYAAGYAVGKTGVGKNNTYSAATGQYNGYEAGYTDGKALYDTGYAAGYAVGKTGVGKNNTYTSGTGEYNGYEAGYTAGKAEYDTGYAAGYAVGKTGVGKNNTYSAGTGQYNGYEAGYTAGKAEYDTGYAAGYAVGKTGVGKNNTYSAATGQYNGYEAGYTDGKALYDTGYAIGFATGIINGYKDNNYTINSGEYNGYEAGFTQGKADYDTGYDVGYSRGLTGASKNNSYTNGTGEYNGYEAGYTAGKALYNAAYSSGYSRGLAGLSNNNSYTNGTGEYNGYEAGYSVGYAAYLASLIPATNGNATPTTPQYDLSYNPVEIIIPITIDSSGGVVELFGSEATRVAYQLRLMTDVSATTIYDPVDGSGLLEYIEASGVELGPTTDNQRRDALDVRFNNLTPKGKALASSFAKALHYSLTHSIDASAVYAGLNTADQQYESLGDFVVSFIAQQVFGHPRASAAISNDHSIITRLNATADISDFIWGPSLNNSNPSGSIAIRLIQALRNLSDEEEIGNEATTPDNLQGRDALRSIVTQMMLQDPARFRVERSELQWLGLEFRPADTLVFNIKLQGFSFNIDGKTGKGGVYADGYAPQIAPTEFSIIFKLC